MRTKTLFRPFLAASWLLVAGCATTSLPVTTTAAVQAPDTSWIERPAIYELFVRDFSPAGNFQGVIDGLDRVQATGVNVIWLMPIYPIGHVNRKGVLGSPYAAADYRGINPDFGTAADFQRLVDAVHARGMKLILDFVPNHTAFDHVWIKNHPDRYTKKANGEITHAIDNDGKPTDWTDVADLNYDNSETRKALIADMRYWVDRFGVDGFRMDVAGFVPHDFWRDALPKLRAKPILLLAEWGDPLMHADGFHLTYGWDAYGGLKEVWKGTSAGQWLTRQVADIVALPNNGRRLYFTTNHDETAWDNPPLTVFTSKQGARAAFVIMSLLPGAPLLYNGQEVESPQKLPLFEKVPIEWNQPGATEARAFYRRLIDLSRTHPSFAQRDLTPIATDAANDVVAYRRGNAVVLVNVRDKALNAAVTGVDLGGRALIQSGTSINGANVAFEPYGFAVLELPR